MALNTLPLLFYNLGGEMLYVIEQRLHAQNIPNDKARKVVSDIVCTMFKPQFIQEILLPQSLYSKRAMRTMFDKLVHSSIMKVNTDSMDKLYDLMIMAVKYQTAQCPQPRSILCITLNHFDQILEFVADDPEATTRVKYVCDTLIDKYGSMDDNEFLLIRQALLSFFQDANNKVSIYLQQRTQNQDGKFVIHKSGHVPMGTSVPGAIYVYRDSKKVITSFSSAGSYEECNISEVVYSINGQRSTNLGCNIYTSSNVDCMVTSRNDYAAAHNSHKLAKAELGLLAKLIGSDVKNRSTEFRLQLFDDNQLATPSNSTSDSYLETDSKVLNIKASNVGMAHLSQVVNDLTISSNTASTSVGEDLLSLMDS